MIHTILYAIAVLLILDLGLGLILALVMVTSSRILEVADHSMEPTLAPGDRVMVSRLLLRVMPAAQGQVVVLQRDGEDLEMIKRIAAVPGEAIPGVDHSLAQDELWLLGDGDSDTVVDSRTWGAVPVSELKGRAWLRCWPLSRAGLLWASQPPGETGTSGP